MKNPVLSLPVLLCSAVLAVTGCGRQGEPAAGAAPAQNPAAGGKVEKAVATAQAQTEVVRPRTQETLTNAQAQKGAKALGGFLPKSQQEGTKE